MRRRIFYLFAAVCLLVACDEEKNKLRNGNKQYEEKAFDKAEEAFRASLAADSTYNKAEYNLASSSYKQERGDKLQTAAKYYDSYQNSLRPDDTTANADVNYNIGNTYFKISQLDTVKETEQCKFYLKKAVDYYKQSLRLNPQDTNAKYNLALSQHLLREENQENKDKQEQQQDQQQQNQQQQQQQQQNQDKQQQNNSQNQNSQSKKDEDKTKNKSEQIKQGEDKNKKQMERMLEALKNSEKQTLNKVKRKDEDNVQKRKIEKDW